jgi:hypothetical protein
LGLLTHAHAQSLPVLEPSGFIDPPGEGSAVNGFVFDANDGRALIGLASNTLPIRNGEVFAFSRDANGAWQPDGSLPNPAPDPDDRFGEAVAIEQDIAVVKATGFGYHVFRRTHSGWTLIQNIEPNAGDELLGILSFRHGVVAIGSSSPSGGPGGVYVYRARGHRLQYVTTLRASDALGSDGFGFRIALSSDGHTLVASAVTQDDNFTGSAYVFERSGQRWIQTQKLQPETEGVLFGDGLAVEGDTLIAGATIENSAHGAAYVYHRDHHLWQLVQHIQPPQDLEPDVFAFGNAIAIGPSHVGIGAHFSNSGRAFVYETTADGLVPSAVIFAPPFFGEQMFFDDTTLLVSSPLEALVHLYEPVL